MEISLSEVQAALGDYLNLTISSDSGEAISLTASIIEIFAPITKSVVAHIRILESSASLPATAILKLFDPRFIDERLPSGNDLEEFPIGRAHPWSLDLELASVQRREAIRRGDLEDNFPELPFEDPDPDPIIWEEHFYRLSKARFEEELEAYSRCKDMQGNSLARCFGSGVLYTNASRPINPPFILLEYIHGTPLPQMDATKITKPLIYNLLSTIITYTARGVIHNDPRPANIIFAPPSPSAPTRAVLLDFGEAIIRRAQSDDEWEEIVKFTGDWKTICMFLIEAGVQGVPLPYDTHIPIGFDIVEATLSLRDKGSGEEHEK